MDVSSVFCTLNFLLRVSKGKFVLFRVPHPVKRVDPVKEFRSQPSKEGSRQTTGSPPCLRSLPPPPHDPTRLVIRDVGTGVRSPVPGDRGRTKVPSFIFDQGDELFPVEREPNSFSKGLETVHHRELPETVQQGRGLQRNYEKVFG